ncbi:MAG: response regulator [Anaerolineae bacterium]|nr:response regulator [Anaerolineae bacterium]
MKLRTATKRTWENQGSRRKALWAALLTLLVLLPIWAWGTPKYRAELLQNQQEIFAREMAPYARKLAVSLHHRLALLEALKAFLQVREIRDPSQKEEVLSFLRHLQECPCFLLLDRQGQKLFYPPECADTLSQAPFLLPEELERIIQQSQEEKPFFSGPHQVGSKELLFAWLPVSKAQAIEGLACTAIDLELLFQQVGLLPPPREMVVAVRDARGQLLYGEARVFHEQPAIAWVSSPDGTWSLAGIPRKGWAALIRRDDYLFRSLSLALVFLIAALVYSTVERRIALEDLIQERTRELQETAEALQRDLAKRREVERALQRSVQEKALILENLGELVTYQDREMRLLWANRAASESIGIPLEEMLGRTCHGLWFHQSEPCTHCPVLRSLQTGKKEVGEIETPDGHIWSVASSPVRDERGQVIGAVRVAMDVTTQRRLEEGLRRAQKMEAIGQLAGGMAHDFNNLLTVINGYSQLVLGSLAPSDPLREDVEQILSAGERAASLVQQLLAFSQRQALNIQPVRLNEIIEEMIPSLRQLIGEDISLELHLGQGIPEIMADSGQIKQILINLAANARDAMTAGGTLTIETAEVLLDEREASQLPEATPGEYALLVVRDTGCGMPPEVLEHVFEPFFTTKGPGKGTGLGLASVYGIVKQLQGFIHLSSQVGQGSTFSLYFPKSQRRPQPPAEKPSKARIPRGTETILIVENREEVRDLLSAMLERLGYTTLVASGVREALALWQEQHASIDLLLVDVILPDGNGPELVRQLQEQTPQVGALYISGYSIDTVADRGIIAEESVLFKPFDLEDLARKVRDVLEGHPRATEEDPQIP